MPSTFADYQRLFGGSGNYLFDRYGVDIQPDPSGVFVFANPPDWVQDESPPFAPFELGKWLAYQRRKSRLRTLNDAFAVVEERAQALEEQLNVRIDRVWQQDRFDSTVQRILAAGATGASVGALIGSVIPGVGNLIGAAIGAIVGAIIGWLPIAQIEFLNAMGSYFASLNRDERYMHFVMFRRLSNRGRDERGVARLGPWIIGWAGPELTRDLGGEGLVANTYFKLWDSCCPSIPPEVPRTYALALATVNNWFPEGGVGNFWGEVRTPNLTFGQSEFAQRVIQGAVNSEWRDIYAANAARPVRDIIAEAQYEGYTDIENMPVPIAVKERLTGVTL